MGLLMKKTMTLSSKPNTADGLFGKKGLRHYISAGSETLSGYSLNVESFKTKSGSGRKYTSAPYAALGEVLAEMARPRLSAADKNACIVNRQKAIVEVLRSLHREREAALDWVKIQNSAPPYREGEKGPHEEKAIAARRHYRPSLIDKLFSKVEQRERELDAAIRAAAKEDAIDYRVWENTVTLAEGVLNRDEDCWLMVLEHMHSFDDLLEFGVGITVGVNKDGCVEAEVNCNTANIVPHQVYMLSQSGKVTRMDTDKASYYNLMRDYICSLAMRIAGDIFATLPAAGLILNIVDDRADAQSGALSQITVLSAAMDAEAVNHLNFGVLNPWRTLSDMYCTMDFRRTEAPGEVKRVVG